MKRETLQQRLDSSTPWFIQMTGIAFVLAIAISLGLADCKHVDYLTGTIIGVLGFIPAAFVVWFPYLVTKGIIEFSKSLPTGATAKG